MAQIMLNLENAGSRPLAFLSGWASFWANDAPSLSIMALARIASNLGFLTPIDPFALGKFIAAGLSPLCCYTCAPLKAAQRFRR